MSERQYALWDPANLSKALTMENIDTASGVSFPFWDEGTRMVYIAGKASFFFYSEYNIIIQRMG